MPRLVVVLVWLASTMVVSCMLVLGPERELATGDGGTGGTGGSASSAGGAFNPCVGERVVWVKQLGGIADQAPNSAAADLQGGVYIAGTFSGLIDLEGAQYVSAGERDQFVAHFDADGRYLWSTHWGDAESQTGVLELAVTPDGGLVVAGDYLGTVDFGGGPQTADYFDGFVAHFDANGRHLWSQVFTGPSYQVVTDVATDPLTGDVYLSGLFHGSIDVDGTVHGGFGDVTTSDAFVAKLDIDTGQRLWSYAFGSPNDDWTKTIAASYAGDVAFAGFAHGDIDFGDGLQPHHGDIHPDAWVAVYDRDGERSWARLYPHSGFELVENIAFTSSHIVAVGRTDGAYDMGGGPVQASRGAFVVQLGLDGQYLDSRAIAGIHESWGLEVDAQDHTVLSGWFTDTLDTWGDTPTQSVGLTDGMVMKLRPDLSDVWTVTMGSEQDDSFMGLAIAPDDGVFAFGGFMKTISVPGCGNFTSVQDIDAVLMKLAP